MNSNNKIAQANNSGSLSSRFVWFVLPPVIVLLGIVVAVWLVKTRPQPKRHMPKEQSTLVNTVNLEKTSEKVILHANGIVVPSREILLQPRVSGTIIGITPQFIPGGRYKKGEEILRIDPTDYKIALEARKADLARAEQEYKLELGKQDIASHEWNLMKESGLTTELDEELTLRKPHIKTAEANMDSAKALLRRAKLDLERTTVYAPFDSVILTKNTDLGAQVSSQTVLAKLAGTDTYWIEATLPVNQLRWLNDFIEGNVPNPSAAILPAGGITSKAKWKGKLIQYRPDLETKGRLSQLLISVNNPMNNASEAPLLLGSYVKTEIEGPVLNAIFVLPRSALRNGNEVWLNKQNRLEIVPVKVLWEEQTRVFIQDTLKENQQIIVSDIAAPIEGMLLLDEKE
ncbi:MAG: efflux RND transporter periplasmic adaptor subunit [Candidatus Theseobacter exili]|nr:efflux RND transporter periplasmic adaptor subunit [Candidatus Theseobacter exili]